MASLTETARAVLEGKQLQEGIYPEVSPGRISNPNPVDPSTASTGNAKTLRPGSKTVDPRHAQTGKGAPGPEAFPNAEDLGGATPTSTAKENLGAKASAGKKRDTSVKGSGTHAEPAKHLEEDDAVEGEVFSEEDKISLAKRLKAIKEARKMEKEKEEDEEDEKEECNEEVELSEELESFINEAIEAGLSEEEILAAIDENFEFVSEESHCDDEDMPKKKSKKEKMDEDLSEELESYEVDMSEHVDALLAGENLSEEFHAKATTIFEAAVKSKLEEEVALLEQAYAETLEERVNEIMEELASNVDDYLNYVVEQWIEENEVAVESALRSELTEDFISGLRALFAEHYIDVPEDSVNVVEELSAANEELEAKLNEEIQRNVELRSVISEARKSELIGAVCEGLTDVQADKFASLLENVAYTNDDEFIDKIETLRENYFPTAVKNDSVLDKVESSSDPQALTESLDGPMGRYVQALGRTLPR